MAPLLLVEELKGLLERLTQVVRGRAVPDLALVPALECAVRHALLNVNYECRRIDSLRIGSSALLVKPVRK